LANYLTHSTHIVLTRKKNGNHTVASQSQPLVRQRQYFHQRIAKMTLQLQWDICGTNLNITEVTED